MSLHNWQLFQSPVCFIDRRVYFSACVAAGGNNYHMYAGRTALFLPYVLSVHLQSVLFYGNPWEQKKKEKQGRPSGSNWP